MTEEASGSFLFEEEKSVSYTLQDHNGTDKAKNNSCT